MSNTPPAQELQKSLKIIESYKSQKDWPAPGSEEEKKLLKKLAKRQRPANLQIQKQQERVKSYVENLLVESKKKHAVKYLVNEDKSPSSLMKPVHNVKFQKLFPDHITALRKVKMDLDPTKADMDVMKNFSIAKDVYNQILDREENAEFETYRDVIVKMGIPLGWAPVKGFKKTNDRGVVFDAIRSGSIPTVDLQMVEKLAEEDDDYKIFKPDPLIIWKKSPSKIASIKKRLDQQIIPDGYLNKKLYEGKSSLPNMFKRGSTKFLATRNQVFVQDEGFSNESKPRISLAPTKEEIEKQKEYSKNQVQFLKERTIAHKENMKRKVYESIPEESYKRNLKKYEKIKGLCRMDSSDFYISKKDVSLKQDLSQRNKLKSMHHLQTNTSLSKFLLEQPSSELDSYRRRNNSEFDINNMKTKNFQILEKNQAGIIKTPTKIQPSQGIPNNLNPNVGYGGFFTESSRKSSFGRIKSLAALKTNDNIEFFDQAESKVMDSHWKTAPEQQEDKYYDAWVSNSEGIRGTPRSNRRQNKENYQILKKKVRIFYEKMVGFHKENDVNKLKTAIKVNFSEIDDDMRLKNEVLFRFDEHLEREMVKELLHDKAKYS